MSRCKKYFGKQVGRFDYDICFLESDISDDKTSMSEIVKRFTLGQEIPNDMTEKNYQYVNPEKLDKSGKPILDENGNIVSDEVLTDEVLSLIPLTPNLDSVFLGDMEEMGELYASATDKARAYIRGKMLAQQKAQVENDLNTLNQLNKMYSNNVVEAPIIASDASKN